MTVAVALRADLTDDGESMRASLDGQPIPLDTPTLGAAIAGARAQAAAAGRVIVEATLDGRQLSDAQLEGADAPSIEGAEARFESARIEDLVREALLGAADLLPVASERQTEAARLLQAGSVADAMAALGYVTEAWQCVRRAVEDSCALAGADPHRLVGAGPAGSLQDAVAALGTRLEDMRRALVAEDWAALADVLEFDMVDAASSWHSMLQTLPGQLTGRSGGAPA